MKNTLEIKKEGVISLMMVLILGMIILVVVISQFSYSTWMRQNLEWSITKLQNQSRASSATLNTAMWYFTDSEVSGSQATTFYLSEADKINQFQLVSGIATTTLPAWCDTNSCKVITTTFNKTPFSITQTMYFNEGRLSGALGFCMYNKVMPSTNPLDAIGIWLPNLTLFRS